MLLLQGQVGLLVQVVSHLKCESDGEKNEVEWPGKAESRQNPW